MSPVSSQSVTKRHSFRLTPGMLLPHESKPWNPLIAGAFYRRGITEKWGRGTLKIAELMVAAAQQAPALVSGDGFVVVTFTRPDNGAVNRDTEQVTPQVTPQVMALLRAIEGEMSRHELMNALNLKDRKHFSASYLKPALSAELVEMTQPDSPSSTQQKYRLTKHGKVARNKALAG